MFATSAAVLHVLCGAGMVHPMEELCRAYQAESGATVQVSYGGSGVLLGELAAGRPCDVFLPAAAEYVEDAARQGWVDQASRTDLVYHVPVLAVAEKEGVAIGCLEDLSRPGVRVGLGDPDACAIGGIADRILECSGLSEPVAANLRVRTPTVNQLLLYLAMGQIDAAIVWEDMVRLPEAGGELRAIAIPPEKNVVSAIAASRGSRSAQPERADAFIRFLSSPGAREVWLKWGFTPCED